jgi:uncharacterized repeat protein (TIGR02543 family)
VDVSPSVGGILELNEAAQPSYPVTSTFISGESVYLKAMPVSGYRFNNWTGDLSGTTNPTSIVIDCNKKITANFSKVKTNWLLFGGIITGIIISALIICLVVRSRTT